MDGYDCDELEGAEVLLGPPLPAGQRQQIEEAWEYMMTSYGAALSNKLLFSRLVDIADTVVGTKGSYSISELREAMDTIDLNKDGRLDQFEFYKYMTNYFLHAESCSKVVGGSNMKDNDDALRSTTAVAGGKKFKSLTIAVLKVNCGKIPAESACMQENVSLKAATVADELSAGYGDSSSSSSALTAGSYILHLAEVFKRFRVHYIKSKLLTPQVCICHHDQGLEDSTIMGYQASKTTGDGYTIRNNEGMSSNKTFRRSSVTFADDYVVSGGDGDVVIKKRQTAAEDVINDESYSAATTQMKSTSSSTSSCEKQIETCCHIADYVADDVAADVAAEDALIAAAGKDLSVPSGLPSSARLSQRAPAQPFTPQYDVAKVNIVSAATCGTDIQPAAATAGVMRMSSIRVSSARHQQHSGSTNQGLSSSSPKNLEKSVVSSAVHPGIGKTSAGIVSGNRILNSFNVRNQLAVAMPRNCSQQSLLTASRTTGSASVVGRGKESSKSFSIPASATSSRTLDRQLSLLKASMRRRPSAGLPADIPYYRQDVSHCPSSALLPLSADTNYAAGDGLLIDGEFCESSTRVVFATKFISSANDSSSSDHKASKAASSSFVKSELKRFAASFGRSVSMKVHPAGVMAASTNNASALSACTAVTAEQVGTFCNGDNNTATASSPPIFKHSSVDLSGVSTCNLTQDTASGGMLVEAPDGTFPLEMDFEGQISHINNSLLPGMASMGLLADDVTDAATSVVSINCGNKLPISATVDESSSSSLSTGVITFYHSTSAGINAMPSRPPGRLLGSPSSLQPAILMKPVVPLASMSPEEKHALEMKKSHSLKARGGVRMQLRGSSGPLLFGSNPECSSNTDFRQHHVLVASNRTASSPMPCSSSSRLHRRSSTTALSCPPSNYYDLMLPMSPGSPSLLCLGTPSSPSSTAIPGRSIQPLLQGKVNAANGMSIYSRNKPMRSPSSRLKRCSSVEDASPPPQPGGMLMMAAAAAAATTCTPGPPLIRSQSSALCCSQQKKNSTSHPAIRSPLSQSSTHVHDSGNEDDGNHYTRDHNGELAVSPLSAVRMTDDHIILHAVASTKWEDFQLNHLQRVNSKSSVSLSPFAPLAYRQNQLEEAAGRTLIVMPPASATHASSVAAAIQQVPHYDQTSSHMSAVVAAAQNHYTSAVTAPHLTAPHRLPATTTKQQLNNNNVSHLDVSSSTTTRKRNIQAGVKIAVLDRYCDSVKSAVSVAQQSVSSILDRLKAAATSVTTSRRLASKQAKKKDQT